MSSDNVIVRITKKAGSVIELEQFETGNGDFSGCGFASRSFVLAALANPSFENEVAKRQKNALAEALPSMETSTWYVDESWFRQNVGAYVKSFTVLARSRRVLGSEAERALIETLAADGDTIDSLIRYAPCARCRAEMTDPKWVQHLEVGDVFGTTSYDVWSEG